MSRFRFSLMLALFLPGLAWADSKPARPNIILVFTDDHAAHAIGAYGSKLNKTPSIDRLAREGMLFRNCFCTNSICAPSRAVILTGKHSHVNGLIDNRVAFDGKQQTFPKLLQKAGYQTAWIGKWHLKSDPTGFDRWAILSAGGGQGTYYNPAFKTDRGDTKIEGYVTDIITDLALDWLKNGRDKDKPFFLSYSHKAPHREWAPGPNHLTLYDDRDIPEPDSLFDDHAGRTSAAKKQEMTIEKHLTDRDLKLIPPNNLTAEQRKKWDAAYGPKNEAFRKAKLTGKDLVRWKYQRYIKDYLRCVAGVDDNLGRLLKYLDDSGLAKNTVVVYSSDQGFYLGDFGWYDKRWMYEPSLRMPLIIRWPGVAKPGSENRDLVQNLDFAETFLEMAGVEVPKDMQGASLVPLLKGETPKNWRKSIYYHYYEFPAVHSVQRHYGVRTERYKLIHYYLIDEWELFDLEKDPGEKRSVYADRGHAEVVKDLKKELERLRELYKVKDFKEPPVRSTGPRINPREVKLSLALQFDFSKVDQNGVLENATKKLTGTITRGKTARGRQQVALRLQGDGAVVLRDSRGLDPAGKPLLVGAWCKPEGDGVIAAQGGVSHGYSLYLRDGVPHFAVRLAGKLITVKAQDRVKPGEWVHLSGVIDVEGKLSILIDGKISGKAMPGGFLQARPADGFSVGADTGSLVGDYENEFRYKGLLEDVRLYWGVPDAAVWKDWLG